MKRRCVDGFESAQGGKYRELGFEPMPTYVCLLQLKECSFDKMKLLG